MKRVLFWAALLLSGAAVVGLGLSGSAGPARVKRAPRHVLTNVDIANILTGPERYRHRAVDFSGQIAAEPEYDKDGTHMQVYVAYGAKSIYIIVDYPATLEIARGDFVNIRGRVGEPFAGATEEKGGRLSTFRVSAGKISGASAEQALAPPKTVWAAKTRQVWRRIEVGVERVEFADTETRFYVMVGNKGPEAIVNQVFNSQAAQAGKMLSPEPGRPGYKELAVDLPSGSSDRGVLVFPPMAPDATVNLALHVSGSGWEHVFSFILRPSRSSPR